MRLLGVAMAIAVALCLVLPLWLLPRSAGQQQRCMAMLQRLARVILAILGIEVRGVGTPPTSAALYLANHRSWLDILVMLTQAPCAFIAKREVGQWPVVGRWAASIGVVFVDRTRKRDLLRAIPALEAQLQAGIPVLLFPEGTTTDGRALQPFKSALVEAAVRAGCPVVPVALHMSASQGDVEAMSWIGDEPLLPNLRRVARLVQPRVTLTWHDARMALIAHRSHQHATARKRLTASARYEIVQTLSGGSAAAAC